MIYPDNFENTIGFSTVRSEVSRRCVSAMGKACCEAMRFVSDYDTLLPLLLEVDEFVKIEQSRADFPLSQYHDLRTELKRLQSPGSFIPADDCAKLRRQLATVDAIRRFFRPEDGEDTPRYPTLARVAAALEPLPAVAAEIDRVVDPVGEVKDNSSMLLYDLRRAIASAQASISTIMQRIISRAKSDGVLEKDTTPSMRDGRLVIPVPPMHKRRIRGIVHDESATGKTLFIEPEEIVETNNRIREAQGEERREVARILTALADELRPHIDPLLSNIDLLGWYDFVRAKALFAIDVDAQMPNVEKEPAIEWYHAVHPALLLSLRAHGKNVVPLDIAINDSDSRIIVISGPNAGGKSVCLKTVGIVQYMMQCGLLPTVYSNSHMGLFNDIFIDIGDQQSIENDLSTYSSHLSNMKTFLSQADDRSLVLIDEMGSGTEPQIGGAIAQAILARLNDKRVRGVVTTHYHNLKTFAQDTHGLVNGAMLYDRQAMTPLFRLSIGYPGSSFAIEIARKMGLPADVIDAASDIVGSDYINLDRYLLDIARDRKYWEKKRHDIRLKERHIEQLIESYNSRLDDLRLEKRGIIKQAKAEAKDILARSNAQIENTIREIRESQAERERTLELRRQLDDFKARLATEEEEAIDAFKPIPARKHEPKQPATPKKTPKAEPRLGVGCHVTLDGGDSVGTVMQLDEKYSIVAFGNLKTRVETKRLKPTLRQPKTANVATVTRATADDIRDRQLQFKTEIDVRGMRTDEALQAVTYFLDDAIQFDYHNLRILHGTGTGALRQAIRQYLAAVHAVKAYHDEHVQLGGAGITVIELE